MWTERKFPGAMSKEEYIRSQGYNPADYFDGKFNDYRGYGNPMPDRLKPALDAGWRYDSMSKGELLTYMESVNYEKK